MVVCLGGRRPDVRRWREKRENSTREGKGTPSRTTQISGGAMPLASLKMPGPLQGANNCQADATDRDQSRDGKFSVVEMTLAAAPLEPYRCELIQARARLILAHHAPFSSEMGHSTSILQLGAEKSSRLNKEVRGLGLFLRCRIVNREAWRANLFVFISCRNATLHS